jgi:hypothetical protein
MPFPANAEEIGRAAIVAYGSPLLADKFATLIGFMARHPTHAAVFPGKSAPTIGSPDYIAKAAARFVKGREAEPPKAPETVPDELVSFILHHYFDIPEASLERVKHEHSLSMGAENVIGDLLERYLATVLEPKGWVWCSGSTVKSVDFIKPPLAENGRWNRLQVKNRDNSENSSSSSVRDGTAIAKWHRTFSKKEGSNWAAFPDANCRVLLSEAAFRSFVHSHLLALKGSR